MSADTPPPARTHVALIRQNGVTQIIHQLSLVRTLAGIVTATAMLVGTAWAVTRPFVANVAHGEIAPVEHRVTVLENQEPLRVTRDQLDLAMAHRDDLRERDKVEILQAIRDLRADINRLTDDALQRAHGGH